MTLRNKVIAALIISLITVFVAIFATMNASHNQIAVVDGQTYVTTHDGLIEMHNDSYDVTLFGAMHIEYAQHNVVIAPRINQPVQKSNLKPAHLPNTSAPHGIVECTLISNGIEFTVSADDCSKLQ